MRRMRVAVRVELTVETELAIPQISDEAREAVYGVLVDAPFVTLRGGLFSVEDVKLSTTEVTPLAYNSQELAAMFEEADPDRP